MLLRPSRRLAPLALVLSTALVLTACSDSRDGDGAQDRTFAPDHIHGLAEEPGTGRLLIATHDGLFALADGDDEPTPVGDTTADLMGFTVSPDGDFHASGHPGPGEPGPSALGLVTSDDAGLTWKNVSLGGEADFHALDATPTAVYGVDAGVRLMRSTDSGESWDELALPQPVVDIAADPGSDALVVTSEAGPLLSTDAGATFAPIAEAPVMVLVDWAEGGSLVGVDPSGQVFTADDPGSWTSRGTVDGAVQALTTGSQGAIYVTTQDALLRSDDGGESFSTVMSY
ncbi:BNR/Asp-box repeat protein [Nocardioides dokdonensis FR1436]|uniref:BNR/Asp-box repeat protein n=1 Tax=Nocardioides dokdonensis FR1436 TaxID=1300347 RepID=A0A1A9GQ54_9ACTN|nr:hypothetical protein [Nocardioides dokdonensis]ANH40444.1 BNR/Asp-box repeat protein [Nocardioides dokdonensis FR1436]